ncbi:aquaporin AQPAe.a isoform X1 [Tribolium castaneum]|nr:PREDICTED: aquaporin AQPAe.a isoform X1 [Tribolium castaneum]|eukprot:XP_015840439.1 PREDICTED: aquaporin AQPAe.a isoform X1 [Tribolium castaneum]
MRDVGNDHRFSVDIPKDCDVTYNKKGQTPALLNGMVIVCAEFIGTAVLVFLSCMGCTKGMFGENITVLQTSLASGLSVTTAIQMFSHISGAHVNPAVTLCAFIMGEISLTSVPIYVGSQIAGSLTGYALLKAVTPDKHLNVSYGHCVTLPHDEISLLQACLVEFIATFIMAVAICAAWDPRNYAKGDSVSLRIGIIVFLLNITAGPYTGASMNPARSFGPTVWNSKWHSHWVYWIGPVLGASLSGQFYKMIFLRRQ